MLDRYERAVLENFGLDHDWEFSKRPEAPLGAKDYYITGAISSLPQSVLESHINKAGEKRSEKGYRLDFSKLQFTGRSLGFLLRALASIAQLPLEAPKRLYKREVAICTCEESEYCCELHHPSAPFQNRRRSLYE